MEYYTISDVSKNYNVSTRTLRYYEEIGILKSVRKQDYSYRLYDESALRCLQQIIILRKLRFSLKQIKIIINCDDISVIIDIFKENSDEFSKEITSLYSIRQILQSFVKRLDNIRTTNKLLSTENNKIVELIESLSLSIKNIKESTSMDIIKEANKVLNKTKDIRVIYIPPIIVAASHYIGDNPEDNANKIMSDFIKNVDLVNIKPDFRVFGFDNPSPRNQGDVYGYEFWVTIPENLEIKEPLEKKRFQGGLYFAHCIKMGDFHEWKQFFQYAQNSDEYEIDNREPKGMDGLLEEELNCYSFYKNSCKDPMDKQLDLLIPIKKYK